MLNRHKRALESYKTRISNVEIRNKRKYQMIKIRNRFEHLNLLFRYCFVFRVSDFGFFANKDDTVKEYYKGIKKH